jgi:hypothetical protein
VHAAPSARRPRLSVVRITQAPKLDGRLDEAVWRAAPGTDAFTQKFPDEGKAPSERTVLRVLHDGRALWVGFECDQRRSKIIARLAPRDRPVESDQVTLTLDSRRSGTNAFEFGVNAAGALSDSLRFNDTEVSTDWDENWDARVHVTPKGWTAEMRIPLRILRFEEDLPVQEWGMQARRTISARQEIIEWAFIQRKTAGEVSHYGKLTGLERLRSPGRVELRPFVLGRVRHRERGAETLAEGKDLSGAAASISSGTLRSRSRSRRRRSPTSDRSRPTRCSSTSRARSWCSPKSAPSSTRASTSSRRSCPCSTRAASGSRRRRLSSAQEKHFLHRPR